MGLKIVLGFFAVAALTIVLWVGSFALGIIGQTGRVIQREANVETQFDRYRWFKRLQATLDKKLANIKIYEQRIEDMRAEYAGLPRSQWDRTDKQTMSQWQQELAGIKAAFNTSCAQYDAAMADIGYRYANIGELPQGATEPLPREYCPYVEG